MDSVPTAPTPRAYPIPRPTSDEHPHLSFGLLVDVCGVLVLHGFPRPQGRDLIALDATLDVFIYGVPADYERDSSAPPGGPLPDGVEGFAISGRNGEKAMTDETTTEDER